MFSFLFPTYFPFLTGWTHSFLPSWSGLEQPREAQEQTCTEQGECTAGALTRHTWNPCLETGKGNVNCPLWDPLPNAFQAAISSNRRGNKNQTCSSWNLITFSRWKHNRGELQTKPATTAAQISGRYKFSLITAPTSITFSFAFFR